MPLGQSGGVYGVVEVSGHHFSTFSVRPVLVVRCAATRAVVSPNRLAEPKSFEDGGILVAVRVRRLSLLGRSQNDFVTEGQDRHGIWPVSGIDLVLIHVSRDLVERVNCDLPELGVGNSADGLGELEMAAPHPVPGGLCRASESIRVSSREGVVESHSEGTLWLPSLREIVRIEHAAECAQECHKDQPRESSRR